jgi:hypothetical protein
MEMVKGYRIECEGDSIIVRAETEDQAFAILERDFGDLPIRELMTFTKFHGYTSEFIE